MHGNDKGEAMQVVYQSHLLYFSIVKSPPNLARIVGLATTVFLPWLRQDEAASLRIIGKNLNPLSRSSISGCQPPDPPPQEDHHCSLSHTHCLLGRGISRLNLGASSPSHRSSLTTRRISIPRKNQRNRAGKLLSWELQRNLKFMEIKI